MCCKCKGNREIAYANTSTWRYGIGGAAITWDVCDICWGSGDENHPGEDLREKEQDGVA